MDIIRQLYGDDIFNEVLKMVFEFFSYFLAGLLGAALRELIVEKQRSAYRILGSSLAAAVILFSIGSQLYKKIDDTHILFGISVLVGFIFPSFASSIKSGKIFKHIVRIFSEKGYTVLKSMEEEEEKAKKDDKSG